MLKSITNLFYQLTQFLKLIKVGDHIYSEFHENFGKLGVDVLNPEELKSESVKEKCKPFCLNLKGLWYFTAAELLLPGLP